MLHIIRRTFDFLEILCILGEPYGPKNTVVR